MTQFQEKILIALKKNGVISEQQENDIRQGMDSAGMSYEEYLMQKFKVKPDQLLKAKSEAFDVPAYRYESSRPVSKKVLSTIPQEAARRYELVPLYQKDNKMVVGVVDPTNLKSRQALGFMFLESELEPFIVVITERDFNDIANLYKGLQVEVTSALEEIETGLTRAIEGVGKKREKEGSEEGGIIKETPVTKIVAVILKHAIEGNASDIHIEPMRDRTRVRYRVDGILYSTLLLPLSVHNSIVARIKILGQLRLDESRIPQDGRFTAPIGGKMIDFRVSSLPTSLGEKIVMRVLDPSTAILEFDDLGLVGRNKARFERAIKEPYGMILVSGPTGSGKTTTLYAALQRVNKEGANIISLEDPIEYYVEGVSQSQIRPEINYTFASGLRSVVRQDPDIIMVGEIRDSETAKLAVQAALTGHLVFSTIHTNNAIGIVPRLRDLGVELFLIPNSILLTMAQRLIGRLCVNCKEEVETPSRTVRMIDEELSKLPKNVLKELKIPHPYKLYNSKGCPKCNHKRTKGRIAIYEVLEMTKELRRIIIEGDASAIKIEQEAQRQGMISMKQDGIIKALNGIVSLEDVLRTVEEQAEEELVE